MSLKEKIYSKLPVYLQNVACEIEGRKIFRRRYSQEFFSIFKKIKYRDRLTQEQMQELQIERLKKQLMQAYENTIYYKELFDSYNFDPYTLQELSEIEIFPIQSKDDVKKNVNKMLNTALSKDEQISVSTSGTTGSGLIYKETKRCENERWAIWWRYRNNLGISFNTWCAHFGGKSVVPLKQKSSLYWRVIKPTKQIMFSMYHLNEKTVLNYIDEINKRKLTWIHGFPSTLSYMASMMIEKNLKINHSIEHITIGSESLLESQKELIKKAFGVYPIQHYGLAEPVANISQCEYGKLHIDEDYSYVELIPIEELDNGYKVIGTSFANDALLFLRYDTNDIVSLAKDQTCKCGRVGRIIEEIEGRKEDFILQKDGTKVGRLGHIFKDMVNVKEAQIRQFKNGEVKFLVVKNNKYSQKDEKILKFEIEKRLDINYIIQYVKKIEKTKNGKLKYVISEIKENEQ